MTAYYTSTIESPLGEVIIIHDGDSLYGLDFADNTDRLTQLMKQHWGLDGLPTTIKESPFDPEVKAYFGGDMRALDVIKTKLKGTEFQRDIWAAIRAIPAGKTMSYGDLAKAIHRPKAVRAVGAANGANPISLIHACHRVIGADGSLTGYAGGLERKKWLLEHEGVGLT
jgi:methylated-DNA-[protein]-cysteine S-methyltransferase